jgi:hypothetical protein
MVESPFLLPMIGDCEMFKWGFGGELENAKCKMQNAK